MSHDMKYSSFPHLMRALSLVLAMTSLTATAQSTNATANTSTTEPSHENKGETDSPMQASKPAQPPIIAGGQTTQAWLALQASGAQASRQRQTLSGPAMKRIHERYLEVFARPVPEWTEQK